MQVLTLSESSHILGCLFWPQTSPPVLIKVALRRGMTTNQRSAYLSRNWLIARDSLVWADQSRCNHTLSNSRTKLLWSPHLTMLIATFALSLINWRFSHSLTLVLELECLVWKSFFCIRNELVRMNLHLGERRSSAENIIVEDWVVFDLVIPTVLEYIFALTPTLINGRLNSLLTLSFYSFPILQPTLHSYPSHPYSSCLLLTF
jgi:hypothetical protein